MLDIDGTASKIDLVELANQSGSQMRHVGGDWRGICPLHKGLDRNEFSIYIKDGRQHFKCFSGPDCGSGDIYDFVMKLNNCDFVTAYRILGGEVNPDPQAVRQAAAERAERATDALRRQIVEAQKILDDLERTQCWLEYHELLELNPNARQLWRARGVPDVYQDIWELGFNPSFSIPTAEGWYKTPTLSIPIFDVGRDILNVRHRLLNPPTPNDKYRPERAGLHASPFICDPDNGWNLDRVFILEGEIKSMVTYIEMDDPKFQMIGIPGKKIIGDLCDKLKGHTVYICLDPDAQEEATKFAKQLCGKVITFPFKIDDGIMKYGLTRQAILRAMRYAR